MTPSTVAWVVAITRPISILLMARELLLNPLYPCDERGDRKSISEIPWPAPSGG
jgi:hypothetical protein